MDVAPTDASPITDLPGGGTALLSTLSHEIRTPLSGIIGLADLLLDLQPGETERHYVRTIIESGNHLLALLNDVLDATRLNAGRLELVETAFDIRAVIRGAVELMEAQAKSKRLSLVLDIAENVPRRAGGDPGRLRQILLNLIGNAVKFTRQGGVRVEVRRGTAQPGALRLCVAVIDSGIGIAPGAACKLFTEFGQTEASISRRFGGSGLGLAICRQLAERMGGAITVESAVGQGSTFSFDVMLRTRRASDETGLPVAEPERTPAVAAALRVLVADDNATNRLVATSMLKRLGHQADAVDDGRQAVTAISEGGYDLLLTDLMMPEMDGRAVAAAIRALPGEISQIPIIGLSASDCASDERACRAAGMNDFAIKPITAARLDEAIRAATTGRTTIGPAAPGRPAQVPVENRTFDPAVLDLLVGELGGEATASMVRRFVDQADSEMSALCERAAVGDDDEIAGHAHAMAQAAGSVGLLRVRHAASRIEPGPLVGAQLAVLAQLLCAGMEELRMWHP